MSLFAYYGGVSMILLLAPFQSHEDCCPDSYDKRESRKGKKKSNSHQQVKFYACSSWLQILMIPELREVTEGTEFKASLGCMYSASKTEQK